MAPTSTGPVLFRLLNDKTQFVIYMKDDYTDACPRYAGPYEDQYFTTQAGTGKREGLNLFIGQVVKMVLYSREGNVGKAGGGGIYDDNWFKMDPHPTKPDLFRLLTPCNNLVVYVNLDLESRLVNGPKDPVNDLHYWSLLKDHSVNATQTTNEG